MNAGRTCAAGLVVMALTGCSWMVSASVKQESVELIHEASTAVPFPASFLGHPWAYFGAVFGQLLTFSVAMAVMFYYIHHLDIKRDAVRKLDGTTSWKSPVNIYRLRLIAFMVTLLLGIGSNLLIYLTWGEVRAETMAFIYTIEKLCKAAVILPFGAAIFLLVETDEVTTLRLATSSYVEPIWPPSKTLAEYKWMLLWVLLLSLGVTYAKWSSMV